MSSNLTYRQMVRRMLMTAMMIISIGCMTFAQKERTDTITRNLYIKSNLDILRRNIILAAVPDLYIITEGPRHHVGETYGKFYYYPNGRFDFNEKLRIGTIDHQRTVFRTMLSYVVPTPYGEDLFPGFVLSPFWKQNRRFYRYRSYSFGDNTYILFTPRIHNSTLTRGNALYNNRTKKLLNASFNGEYDNIEYHLDVTMDSLKNTPQECLLQAKFRFLGNKIDSKLHARYDNVAPTLPDTIADSNDPRLMAKVRKDTLTESEQAAYADKYKEKTADTTQTRHRRNILDRAWSVIDDYFISSIRFGNDKASVKFSPLLDPVGFDYSSSKGISYRLKLRCGWKMSEHRQFEFNGRASYFFKQKRLYYQLPLRYTFNERREGYIELFFANGNRISDSRILSKLQDNTRRDTVNFNNLNLDYFKDRELNLHVNIPIGRHFYLALATVYHDRRALNADEMKRMGEPTSYKSFAPSITFKYQPSRYVAYTINYERGIPNVLGSDLSYERIEGDVQMSKKFSALQSFNIRVGAGGYTQHKTTYFVDYANFTENNLPEAWDEWKGRFYLLSSDLYNASNYYIRENLSYESPLLPLAYIPFIGYYIEKECIYLSAVQMKHTRPYFELGYAFTTRFAAFGLFASTFGTKINEIGTKITFELFRHW